MPVNMERVGFVPVLLEPTPSTRNRELVPSYQDRDAAKEPSGTPEINGKDIKISYDQQIGRFVVQFVDSKSGKTVEQIPCEEMVSFLRRFRKAYSSPVK